MKKLFTCALCGSLLFIAGCSDASTSPDKEDTVLLSVGGEDITKDDIYHSLIAEGDISPVTTAMENMLTNLAVPTTEEIEKAAKESLEALKKAKGDSWKQFLKDNGYKNEKEYYQKVSLVNAKSGKLVSTYVNDNYYDLMKELEVKKLQIAVIDNADKLKDVNKAIKAKKEISEIANTYGNTETYKGTDNIYTNKDGIPAVIWTEINKTKDGKTFNEAIADPTTGKYYVVKVVSTNAKELETEAKAVLNSLTTYEENGLTFPEYVFHYYLDKFDYGVYDATVYSALLSNSQKYER